MNLRQSVAAFAAGMAFSAAPALPACAPHDGPYAFQPSKPAGLRPKDLWFEPDGGGSRLASRVSRGTPIERNGTKRSQRSELRETTESAVEAPPGRVCYSFEMQISKVSSLPPQTPLPVKLTVAQFHEEAGRPVLFLNLTPQGALVAETGERVGKRTHVLIPAEALRFGAWIRVEISVHWSATPEGRLDIRIDDGGGDGVKLVVQDRRATLVAGPVYQKLGVYRSFLERAPEYAGEQVLVRYRKIGRNGVTAAFRP